MQPRWAIFLIRNSSRNDQRAVRSVDANALEVRPSRPRLRYLVRTSTCRWEVLVWPPAVFRDAELVPIALDWRMNVHAQLRRFYATQAYFSSFQSAIYTQLNIVSRGVVVFSEHAMPLITQ